MASTIASTSASPFPALTGDSWSSNGSVAPLAHDVPSDTYPVEWSYEMRRTAQEILTGLFVGPYQTSRSLPDLQNLGITHVVCVYDKREAAFVKPRFPEHFSYLPLEVRDAQDENLIRLFPKAKDYIDNALRGRGRVLVHCGDGISRSPALVVAYVMCVKGIPHDEAFQYVQARRFCASPNINFQRQIEAYESIHNASLAMAQYSNQMDENAGRSRRKRNDGSEDAEGGEQHSEDEELRERNLHAQRRKNDDGHQMARFQGDSMDTS